MAVSLTLRNTKGSALTFTEMDTNLTNLKNAVDAVDTSTVVSISTNQTISGPKTFTAVNTFSNSVQLTGVRETVYALGTRGGTLAPDASSGTVMTVSLSSALTINGFTNPVAGQSVSLIVTTNGYTTCTSTMKFAGGAKTFSTQTDILNVLYDGTNYWAGIVKGYA